MTKSRLSIGVVAGFLLPMVFLVALVAPSAEAEEWTTRFGVGGGLGYTDNVRLAPSGEEESDLLLSVNSSMQLRKVSGRTNTNTCMGADQIVLLIGSGNTQFLPSLQAGINHELIKRRLSVTADANVRRTFSIRDDRVSSTGFSDDADISGNVGVGAFYREHLGTLADVNASYRYNRFGTRDDFVSNAGSHSVNLQARSGQVIPRLIWSGSYSANKQEGGNDFKDYSVGFNIA